MQCTLLSSLVKKGHEINQTCGCVCLRALEPWISKGKITTSWGSVDEDYHSLYTGDEVRLKPSTNQTECQLLSRRQQQSVWRANKTPVVATVTWTREFQNTQRTTRIEANLHKSEIRRGAMTFHTLHFVITTYRRFYELESAYFSVWKHNTSFCSTLATTAFPSRLAALLLGKLQVCGKRTAIIWNYINSLQKMATKHSNRVRLQVQKCKCASYHHLASSCNFNQSRAEEEGGATR